MSVIRIDNLHDPRVADYQSVGDAVSLRHRGLFVAEGRLVVERVIASGRHRVVSALLSPASASALARLLQQYPEFPAFVCPAPEFAGLAGLNLHRGCLALVERPVPPPVESLTAQATTVVVLEGVGNPDNLGGIFRNAAAFSVDAVLLGSGCVDPLYRKAIRTSMGAVLQVPWATIEPWPDGLRALRDRQFAIMALSPRRPGIALEACAERRPGDRLAVMLGAEGEGLTEAALAHADLRVRIPTTTRVDSLNVAVASGIALARLAPVGELAT
ncbi:MAG: TrmH family RNA methyltransferase [Vicinamibacterales bacterium]